MVQAALEKVLNDRVIDLLADKLLAYQSQENTRLSVLQAERKEVKHRIVVNFNYREGGRTVTLEEVLGSLLDGNGAPGTALRKRRAVFCCGIPGCCELMVHHRGTRTARAGRLTSRPAKTPLRGVFRARESPRESSRPAARGGGRELPGFAAGALAN